MLKEFGIAKIEDLTKGQKAEINSFFKKQGGEEPPIPINPPKKVDDTFSKQDTIPPPKIENFNNDCLYLTISANTERINTSFS